MTKQTTELINKLKKAKSIKELKRLVEFAHNSIKDKLTKKSIRFYEDESIFPQDIIEGQKINFDEFHEYDEINFIRKGIIKKKWVSVIEERDKSNFKEIKKNVLSILNNKNGTRK